MQSGKKIEKSLFPMPKKINTNYLASQMVDIFNFRIWLQLTEGFNDSNSI